MAPPKKPSRSKKSLAAASPKVSSRDLVWAAVRQKHPDAKRGMTKSGTTMYYYEDSATQKRVNIRAPKLYKEEASPSKAAAKKKKKRGSTTRDDAHKSLKAPAVAVSGGLQLPKGVHAAAFGRSSSRNRRDDDDDDDDDVDSDDSADDSDNDSSKSAHVGVHELAAAAALYDSKSVAATAAAAAALSQVGAPKSPNVYEEDYEEFEEYENYDEDDVNVGVQELSAAAALYDTEQRESTRRTIVSRWNDVYGEKFSAKANYDLARDEYAMRVIEPERDQWTAMNHLNLPPAMFVRLNMETPRQVRGSNDNNPFIHPAYGQLVLQVNLRQYAVFATDPRDRKQQQLTTDTTPTAISQARRSQLPPPLHLQLFIDVAGEMYGDCTREHPPIRGSFVVPLAASGRQVSEVLDMGRHHRIEPSYPQYVDELARALHVDRLHPAVEARVRAVHTDANIQMGGHPNVPGLCERGRQTRTHTVWPLLQMCVPAALQDRLGWGITKFACYVTCASEQECGPYTRNTSAMQGGTTNTRLQVNPNELELYYE